MCARSPGLLLGSRKHLLKVNVLYSRAAVGNQILITKDHSSILVDVGDGTLRDLVDRRFMFEKLKAALLTHEHFDHISGLYSLVSFFALLGHKQSLVIATPCPSARIHTLPRPPLMHYSPRYQIPILELSGGDKTQIKPFQVGALQVSIHGANSLGYSILKDD